jgi:hypothetical protein
MKCFMHTLSHRAAFFSVSLRSCRLPFARKIGSMAWAFALIVGVACLATFPTVNAQLGTVNAQLGTRVHRLQQHTRDSKRRLRSTGSVV